MFHCPVGVWLIEQRAIILSATLRSPTVLGGCAALRRFLPLLLTRAREAWATLYHSKYPTKHRSRGTWDKAVADVIFKMPAAAISHLKVRTKSIDEADIKHKKLVKQLKMAAASHIAFWAPVLPFTMDNLANFPFNSELNVHSFFTVTVCPRWLS